MTKDEQWLLEEKYGGVESDAYKEDCARLQNGEPLAYVIGWQPFLGLKIFLDSKPLIPRVETEWWTEQLLKKACGEPVCTTEGLPRATASGMSKFSAENCAYPKASTSVRQEIKCLDLCAGSGAIGCAMLARLAEARVYFGEIDPEHETTILKNIHENGLDDFRAAVRIGDLFAPFSGMTFDLVVANPPYIPANRVLEKSVTEYEPALALFSGDDGLDVIRRIARELPTYLASQGEAWIEVDAPRAAAARALFVEQGFSVVILPDQYDQPRVLVVS